MTILGIESATAVCGAAIVRDQSVVAERKIIGRHIHSEKLIALIDEVVRSAGEYDVIAVSIGPGSFTGLRIGLSVAKGLAVAGDKPIIGVPTLEALALRAVAANLTQSSVRILTLIDARRSDVYAALYRIEDDRPIEVWGACAASVSEILEWISPDHAVVCMGDGVEKFRDYVASAKEIDRFIVPPPEHRLCSAAMVALLGERRAMRGEFSDVRVLEPLYVRDFVSLVKSQHAS